MADGIKLRLARRDMNVFRTDDRDGERVRVHVAGRHPAALCPACAHPSVDTNGTGWRDVIDVVRTLVVTLSVCVRRFVCGNEDCPQRSFDERFEGIDRGGASHRALAFFADLARGRASAAVARDLGVPAHYLRAAVGACRRRASAIQAPRLGTHLAIDECSIKRNYVYATVFSDPNRGVVLGVEPGRDGAAIAAFASAYRRRLRVRVAVVSIDSHNAYRYMVRIVFPHAMIVTDAFHLHRQALEALAKVRRSATGRVARGRSGRARLPKMARHALARAGDELNADTSEHGARQRAVVVEVCGLDPPLALAYELKEEFRAAMAIGKAGDVEGFAVALNTFDTRCRASKLAPFKTLANSLRSWREEILNYARTGGASNAFAESLNHLIKNQKRQAHGYATWAGFKGQILWCFGEVVDPETGEILTLRSIPRGEGARYHQPQFA
ncbi:MAG: ISL3 family transposase [Acidimicrobiales bacterium]|nr:ISL3 family transposase [Actinomycetota bacterium]